MIILGVDGIDFINVYSKGSTELGRWLSNFAHSPFECEHGEFASVEAYWYWLRCEDDALRSLHGYRAKSEGKKRKRVIERDDFEALIKKAIDLKLKSDRALIIEFAKSELPLCHFYEYSGKRTDAGYEWIVSHLEMRRSLLKDWLKTKA